MEIQEQKHIDEDWFSVRKEVLKLDKPEEKIPELKISDEEAKARQELFLEANGVEVKQDNSELVSNWKLKIRSEIGDLIAESPSANYYQFFDTAVKEEYLDSISKTKQELYDLREKIKLEIKDLREEELKELRDLNELGLKKKKLSLRREAHRKDIRYKEIREKRAAAVLHRQMIQEDILRINMDRAAVMGDMPLFNELNRKIHLDVNPEIFEHTIIQLLSDIEKYYDPQNPPVDPNNVQIAARELYDVLPKLKGLRIGEPQKRTFDIAKEKVKSRLAFFHTLKGIEGLENFNVDQIKSVFNEALKLLEADKDGWKADEDPRLKASITIRPDEKLVGIPKSRKVGILKLKKLIAHEIYIHIKRRLDGSKSKLALLGRGLRRYLNTEEGVTTQAEQVLNEKFNNYAGTQYYLAGGLIAGLDGTKRNFRDTFQILRKYYAFKNATKAEDEDEEESKKVRTPEDKAYSTCKRMFRDTTGVDDGVFNRKDLSYKAGNIGVWRLLDKDFKRLMTFSVGKWNVTSDSQYVLLCELGIIKEPKHKRLRSEVLRIHKSREKFKSKASEIYGKHNANNRRSVN